MKVPDGTLPLQLLCFQAVEEAERKARQEAEVKAREDEERKAKEELERKAAEESSSATGQIRASLTKNDPAATVKLLNSFTVENGPAQRMSYLMEVCLWSFIPHLPAETAFAAQSAPVQYGWLETLPWHCLPF